MKFALNGLVFLAATLATIMSAAEEFNPALQDIYYGEDSSGTHSCIHVAGKDVFVLLHGEIATPIKPPKIPSFTLTESGTYVGGPQGYLVGSSFKNTDIKYEEIGQANFSCLNLVKAVIGVDYLVADYNGDGLDDLFIRGKAGTDDQSLVLHSGAANKPVIATSFSTTVNYLGDSYTNISKDFNDRTVQLFAEDVNSDGKADLVVEGGAYADYAYLSGVVYGPADSPYFLRKPDVELASLIGTSQASFQVDASGSAGYTIPIAVPVGTAGVTPQLALSYSSQSNNGVAGKGWSLAGVSSLSRCRQTKAIEGGSEPLSLSNNDRLCLDGQRLILVSGSWFGAGSVYKTEIDSYAKITAKSKSGGLYFEVAPKDGSVTRYGYSADSEQRINGVQINWMQDQYRDSVGNAIDYVYVDDASGQRLTEVLYAYGAGLDAGARVVFNYNFDRPDPASGYILGTQVISKALLTSIEVFNRNPIGSGLGVEHQVRDYTLRYLKHSNLASDLYKVTRLSSVQECAIDQCLPALSFEWAEVETGFSSTAFPLDLDQGGSYTPSNYRPVDINGDGLQDVLWLEYTGGGAQRWRYRIAKADGGFYDAQTAFSKTQAVQTLENWDVADYNADGRADLFVADGNTGWRVFLAQPSATADGDWVLNTAGSETLGLTEKNANFIDVNSDGLVDLVYEKNDILYVRTMEKSGADVSSNKFYQFGTPVAYSLSNAGSPGPEYSLSNVELVPASFGDFNADGRMDVVLKLRWNSFDNECAGDGQPIPYMMGDCNVSGGVVEYQAAFVSVGASFKRYGEKISYAGDLKSVDFNADGLTDLLRSGKLYLNTGDGFHERAAPAVAYFDSAQSFDFNHDGYADLIFADKSTKKLNVALWNPEISGLMVPIAIRGISGSENESHQFVDFNGDGRTDYINFNQDVINAYPAVGAGVPGSAIDKIINGLGAETHIVYSPLSRTENYSRLQFSTSEHIREVPFRGGRNGNYLETDTITYNVANADDFYRRLNGPWELPAGSQSLEKLEPTLEVLGPLYVVTRIRGSAPSAASVPGAVNAGALNAVNYFYAEAKLQAGGRGFLGFRRVKEVEEHSGVATTTDYRQDFPFIGHPVQTLVTSAQDQLLSESLSTWSFLSKNGIGAKYYQNNREEVVQKGYALLNDGASQGALLQSVKTETTLDEYGNTKQVIVTTTGNAESFVKKTESWYGDSGWEREMGRLSRSEVTTSRPGSPTNLRTTEFNYYTSGSHKGLLKEEIVEPDLHIDPNDPDSPLAGIRTEYGYDLFGNRNATTQYGHDISARTSSTQYDEFGRHLLYGTNALNHKLSWVVDSERNPMGLPLKVYAANGDVITKSYDALGRETKVTTNAGVETETSLYKCNASCPASAVYYSEVSRAGVLGGVARQYIDALGRVVRTGSRAFDGGWNYVDTEYDLLGQVRYKSSPYRSGASKYWAEFTYDLFGRSVTTKLPGIAQSASVSYEGFESVYTNPKGQIKREQRNALGELVKVTDALTGMVTFHYDAVGNLEETRTSADGSTITTRVQYDDLGRKISMQDPDKGAWSYTYYANGALKTQTDAENQVTEFTYDLIGRVLTRVDWSAGKVKKTADSEWQYDTAKNGLGQLRVVKDHVSGYEEEHSYDSLGRPKDVTYRLGHNKALGEYYQAVRYDQFGRASAVYDAAGILPTDESTHNNRITFGYNAYGYQETVTDSALNKVVYRVREMDARGNVTLSEQGNGVQTRHDFYEDTGMLRAINANLSIFEVQRQRFEWDVLGNLELREDYSDVKSVREHFTYDSLNRLETAQIEGRELKTITYDGHGNIKSKTGVGSYIYGLNSGSCGGSLSTAIRPHAVCKVGSTESFTYDDNGNLLSDSKRNLTYSTFDKPTEVKTAGHTTTFAYGPSRARYLRTDTDAQENTTQTIYLGNVEIITKPNGDQELRRSLPGGAQVTLKRPAANPSVETVKANYLHYDHLGSIDVITDSAAVVVQAMSFDAWGQRRHGGNWSDLSQAARQSFDSGITRRGFTGHEMVDQSGIIHMNGRIYDATLGRFLQADILVDGVTSTQGYNRYAYVKNNPLNATDPTGHNIFKKAHDFATGSAKKLHNFSTKHVNQTLQGSPTFHALVHLTKVHFRLHDGVSSNVGIVGNIDSYIARNQWVDYVGMIAGWINPFVGMAVNAHIAYTRGASINGIVQNGIASFGMSFVGSVLPFRQGVPNLIQSMAVGGTMSYLNGGKFANGAATAAFMWGLNAAVRSYNEYLDGGDECSPEVCEVGIAEFEMDETEKLREYERLVSEAERQAAELERLQNDCGLVDCRSNSQKRIDAKLEVENRIDESRQALLNGAKENFGDAVLGAIDPKGKMNFGAIIIGTQGDVVLDRLFIMQNVDAIMNLYRQSEYRKIDLRYPVEN